MTEKKTSPEQGRRIRVLVAKPGLMGTTAAQKLWHALCVMPAWK